MLLLLSCSSLAQPDPVPCQESTSRVDNIPPHLTVLADSVALPLGLALELNEAPPVEGGSLGFFAKQGLLVRTNDLVTLSIVGDSQGTAEIGWGAPADPTDRVSVGACGIDEWWVFSGGYWSDQPICVELDVEISGEIQTVFVGLGLECPSEP